MSENVRMRVRPLPSPQTSAVADPAPAAPVAPPVGKEGHVGQINVSRMVYGQETMSSETISVPVLRGIEPARVRVGGSLTINLGNYQSAKVDVSVELPCLPEASEIQRAYLEASRLTDDFIRREKEIVVGNS